MDIRRCDVYVTLYWRSWKRCHFVAHPAHWTELKYVSAVQFISVQFCRFAL